MIMIMSRGAHDQRTDWVERGCTTRLRRCSSRIWWTGTPAVVVGLGAVVQGIVERGRGRGSPKLSTCAGCGTSTRNRTVLVGVYGTVLWGTIRFARPFCGEQSVVSKCGQQFVEGSRIWMVSIPAFGRG